MTTNPSLYEEWSCPEKVYEEPGHGIKDIMEVVGTQEEMVSEGLRLAEKFGDCCTVKLPCTPDGLLVCDYLSKKGIRVNVTLIFNAAQDVLAKAGATYISNFVGRLDNSIAVLVVRSIADLYRIRGIETKVLASYSWVHRAVRSWYNGAEIVTMPPSVFEKMYNHVLTVKV